MSSAQKHADEQCQIIYQEAREFFASTRAALSPNWHGFSILYGPPIVSASIVFLGFQPGGNLEHDDAAATARDWPRHCEYAIAPWRLAEKIRRIWNAEFLKECTGLNVVFARASAVSEWRRVPVPLRTTIEDFSKKRAEVILRLLQPKRVVIIGLETFARVATASKELKSDSGKRTLAIDGEVWGLPATGVPHLTGSRISGVDFQKITAHLVNPR